MRESVNLRIAKVMTECGFALRAVFLLDCHEFDKSNSRNDGTESESTNPRFALAMMIRRELLCVNLSICLNFAIMPKIFTL